MPAAVARLLERAASAPRHVERNDNDSILLSRPALILDGGTAIGADSKFKQRFQYHR